MTALTDFYQSPSITSILKIHHRFHSVMHHLDDSLPYVLLQ
jgi:hypothetical protein